VVNHPIVCGLRLVARSFPDAGFRCATVIALARFGDGKSNDVNLFPSLPFGLVGAKSGNLITACDGNFPSPGYPGPDLTVFANGKDVAFVFASFSSI
jgi:hypothetical protein